MGFYSMQSLYTIKYSYICDWFCASPPLTHIQFFEVVECMPVTLILSALPACTMPKSAQHPRASADIRMR